VRGCCFWVELLSADAAEAAWNYCAPVVDYDGVRRDVSSIFADKAAEVQSLVAKLQKTQRAAEQALDKFGFSVQMVACALGHPMQILSPGMRRRAQNRGGARVRRWVFMGPRCSFCAGNLHGHRFAVRLLILQLCLCWVQHGHCIHACGLSRKHFVRIFQAPTLHSHNACRFCFVHICCGGCVQLPATGIGAAYKIS